MRLFIRIELQLWLRLLKDRLYTERALGFPHTYTVVEKLDLSNNYRQSLPCFQEPPAIPSSCPKMNDFTSDRDHSY